MGPVAPLSKRRDGRRRGHPLPRGQRARARLSGLEVWASSTNRPIPCQRRTRTRPAPQPENIVLQHKSIDSPIVLIDFSLASFFHTPTEPGGTPEFVAPELLADPERWAPGMRPDSNLAVGWKPLNEAPKIID